MNGSLLLESNPATIGPTKNGPNLLSYNVELTKLANVFGSISLSSLILYKLFLNLKVSDNVITSDANPVNPKKVLSPSWKIFSKLLANPNDWFPKRKSQAIAIHSLPTIATAEPPIFVSTPLQI